MVLPLMGTIDASPNVCINIDIGIDTNNNSDISIQIGIDIDASIRTSINSKGLQEGSWRCMSELTDALALFG